MKRRLASLVLGILLNVAFLALFAIASTAIASGAGNAAPSKVVVHVSDASNGKPVAGTTIYLVKQGGRFVDFFMATTDTDGNAIFSDPLTPGTWMIEKYQGFGGMWKSAKGSVVVTAGNQNYHVSLPLTRTHTRSSDTTLEPVAGERGLVIFVRGRTPDGRIVPVHFATIFDASERKIAMTDYNGRAFVRHDLPMGEVYELKAEATYWKTGTSSFTVGLGRGNSTAANDLVNFVLEPEGSEAAQGVKLTVEVLDHDTDQPISSAGVTLYKPNKFPGIAVASKGTNAKGEAVFESGAVDNARLQGSARVGVKANGYQNVVQDVPAELFSNKDAHYLVYLKPLRFHLPSTFKVTETSGYGTYTGTYTLAADKRSYTFIYDNGSRGTATIGHFDERSASFTRNDTGGPAKGHTYTYVTKPQSAAGPPLRGSFLGGSGTFVLSW